MIWIGGLLSEDFFFTQDINVIIVAPIFSKHKLSIKGKNIVILANVVAEKEVTIVAQEEIFYYGLVRSNGFKQISSLLGKIYSAPMDSEIIKKINILVGVDLSIESNLGASVVRFEAVPVDRPPVLPNILITHFSKSSSTNHYVPLNTTEQTQTKITDYPGETSEKVREELFLQTTKNYPSPSNHPSTSNYSPPSKQPPLSNYPPPSIHPSTSNYSPPSIHPSTSNYSPPTKQPSLSIYPPPSNHLFHKFSKTNPDSNNQIHQLVTNSPSYPLQLPTPSTISRSPGDLTANKYYGENKKQNNDRDDYTQPAKKIRILNNINPISSTLPDLASVFLKSSPENKEKTTLN